MLFVVVLLLLLLLIIIFQSVVQVVYQQDNIIHKFVRKIMVLLFLPAQIILLMFVRIESLVLPNGIMCKLINYVFQPRINIQC